MSNWRIYFGQVANRFMGHGISNEKELERLWAHFQPTQAYQQTKGSYVFVGSLNLIICLKKGSPVLPSSNSSKTFKIWQNQSLNFDACLNQVKCTDVLLTEWECELPSPLEERHPLRIIPDTTYITNLSRSLQREPLIEGIVFPSRCSGFKFRSMTSGFNFYICPRLSQSPVLK